MITTPERLGWVRDLPDFRDIPFKLAAPLALPPSVRLVWIPGALNQGLLGSCTANAVAGADHFNRMKQRSNPSFSPSRLFNYYNAREMHGWQDVDTGAYIRDSIKSMAHQGNVPEDMWPYDIARFRERPPDQVYADAVKHRTFLYRRISHSLDEMKGCLAEGFPFVFGFSVYDNFNWGGPAIDLPGPDSRLLGGHAVLAYAYDDATRRFGFINSWGEGFGEFGRGTIPYEYLTNEQLSADFWTINQVF